jgi:hypothetical protein
MFRRNLTHQIAIALTDTPVVLIAGARQVGKSTLARQVAGDSASAYLTLDDPGVLALARRDPDAFVRQPGGGITVIDEVQREPDLFRAIKYTVDQDRRPGRFLLTGSANYLVLPRVSESLAGRIEIQALWPLSQGEREGVIDGFVDAVFDPDRSLTVTRRATRDDLLERLVTGGYPEAVARLSASRRHAWFTAYVTTLLERDVRDISNVESLTAFPRLLRLLAARAGSLVNVADVSRSTELPYTTLHRYLAILAATFILQPLPPWSANLTTRLVKSPKYFLDDSGLTAYLLDTEVPRLRRDPVLIGPLLETFVLAELRKQATWSDRTPSFSFFRTQAGAEVDIVMEARGGDVVGIEVKASSTIGPKDFRGLTLLRDALGPKFIRGIMLYTGEYTLPFGDKLWAMPVDALWRLGATPQGER